MKTELPPSAYVLFGVVTGAATMFFFDPELGWRRRALLREGLASAGIQLESALLAMTRDPSAGAGWRGRLAHWHELCARDLSKKRIEPALFVDEKQVRMIVRDDPPDIRHDGRTQCGDVTLCDDRVGHREQRSPVIALGLQLALTRHGLLLMAFVVDRHGQQPADVPQETGVALTVRFFAR